MKKNCKNCGISIQPNEDGFCSFECKIQYNQENKDDK